MPKLTRAFEFAKQKKAHIWLFSILGSFSVGTLTPPHGNQFVYFTPLYRDVFSNLKSDWYANTSDSNIAFTIMSKILYHSFSFSQIQIFGQWNLILVLLLNTVNIFFIFQIIRILDNRKFLKDFETITLIVVCLVFTFPDFKSGVAGLYFIQPLLQPSSFGTFFLSGLYFTFVALNSQISVMKKLINANFLYTVSLIFHPSLLASYLIVSLAIVATNLKKIDRNKQLVALQVIFSLSAILITFLLNPESLKFIHPNFELKNSLQYFAEFRIPYHVDPKVWLSHEELVRLIVVFLSAIAVRVCFGKKHKISTFYSLISIAIPVTSIVAALTNNTSLMLAMPWRISIFLYPIAQLVLLAAAINFSLNQATFNKLLITVFSIDLVLYAMQMTKVALVLTALIFICKSANNWTNQTLRIILSLVATIYASLYGFEHTANAYATEKVAVHEEFLNSTELKGVGLVPTESNNLRLRYGLAIYVNNQAVPNASSSIIEWHRRLLIADRIYKKPSRICNSEIRHQVRWAILPQSQTLPQCLRNQRVIEGKTWKVVIIDDTKF